MMTNLILIRGPAAVGKTTISRKLVKELPGSAYISEDMFRGWLQVKRGETNKTTYKNSAIYIQNLIDKMLEIDSYKNIVIEGLFPDIKVLETYFNYAKKNNHKIFLFQLKAKKKSLVERNTIGRGHKVRRKAIDDHWTLFKEAPKEATVIDTDMPVEKSVRKICLEIKS